MLKTSSFFKSIFIFVSAFLFALPVWAEEVKDKYGLNETTNAAGIPTSGTLAGKAGTLIGYGLSLIGVLFFGLMIYGGFLWMTAKGDEGQATKAQQIIVDAIIGLVVVAASYIITKFVFGAIK